MGLHKKKRCVWTLPTLMSRIKKLNLMKKKINYGSFYLVASAFLLAFRYAFIASFCCICDQSIFPFNKIIDNNVINLKKTCLNISKNLCRSLKMLLNENSLAESLLSVKWTIIKMVMTEKFGHPLIIRVNDYYKNKLFLSIKWILY